MKNNKAIKKRIDTYLKRCSKDKEFIAEVMQSRDCTGKFLYCSYCNKRVDKKSNFCKSCGILLDWSIQYAKQQ